MLKRFSGENGEEICFYLPGGPWMIASSLVSANTKASCWASSMASWSCDGQFSIFVESKWNVWVSEESHKVKCSFELIYAGIDMSLETFIMYFSNGKSSSESNLWRTPSVCRYALDENVIIQIMNISKYETYFEIRFGFKQNSISKWQSVPNGHVSFLSMYFERYHVLIDPHHHTKHKIAQIFIAENECWAF